MVSNKGALKLSIILPLVRIKPVLINEDSGDEKKYRELMIFVGKSIIYHLLQTKEYYIFIQKKTIKDDSLS
jgi:hypothetical protein